jgi:hypothetical protein
MRILLLLLLTMTALADDQAEFARLVPAKLVKVERAGDFALLGWQHPEAEGQSLVRKIDGRWWLLTGGGGYIDGGVMWQYGVPEAVIHKLGRSGGERPPGPYWTWLTRKKDLTEQDLADYRAFELTLMRNEIFALRGRVFRDPVLAAYFKSRSWYRPNPAYSDALLTERERRNAAFIAAYQQRAKKEF